MLSCASVENGASLERKDASPHRGDWPRLDVSSLCNRVLNLDVKRSRVVERGFKARVHRIDISDAFDPAATVRLVRIFAKAVLSLRLTQAQTMQQVRHAVTLVLQRLVRIGQVVVAAPIAVIFVVNDR